MAKSRRLIFELTKDGMATITLPSGGAPVARFKFVVTALEFPESRKKEIDVTKSSKRAIGVPDELIIYGRIKGPLEWIKK